MTTTTSTIRVGEEPCPSTTHRTGIILILGFAATTVLAHWLVGNRYGFQRDELQTLDDARHLAWGYVAYPSLTPLFGRLSLTLFGTSLRGFRLFASLALAAALLLSGLVARQLGGRRGAQLLTVFAVLPAAIGAGMLMQYVAFDYLCWVLTAYFVVRLLASDDPRWWLAIGAAIGSGMEAKYTMGFLALGVAAGTLLTDARRYLRSKWLWMGVAVSILFFLPNLTWQARHGFVSFDFLRHIHARDIRLHRTKDFLPDQLKMTLLATPLWIAGLWFFLFSSEGKRFRLLGWMYVVPLLLFVAAKGRGYYLQPAYPCSGASNPANLPATPRRLTMSATKKPKIILTSSFAAALSRAGPTSGATSTTTAKAVNLSKAGSAQMKRENFGSCYWPKHSALSRILTSYL